jgi:hypothetical protein
MKFKDISLTLIILILFSLFYLVNFLAIGKKNIEKNWPKYRCNPAVMPFADMFGHSSTDNFVYCIQNMQTNYIGYLLSPIHYSLDLVNNMTSELSEASNFVRTKFFNNRIFQTNIVESIFGVFLNALIQFQKVTIKVKEIISKMVGIATTMLFMVDGAAKTGTSVWKGPVGGVLRTVCFEPSTVLELEKGEKKEMKNVTLGDVLHNGSKIIGSVTLLNPLKEHFYKVPRKEGQNNHIFVTGSHLIKDKNTGRFIPVKECSYCKKTDIIPEQLHCLITDDHLIKIDEHTFWDYEDA